MAKNDFQYGGSNSYTLQCGMWLWGDMPLNSPKRPPYRNSTSGFHSHTPPQSTCHSVPVCEILSKSDHPRQKKLTSCRFSRWRISAILDCRDLIMGSLKSQCTTSYRSLIVTIALNCLVFEKIGFFAFWRQRGVQLRCTKPLSLANLAIWGEVTPGAIFTEYYMWADIVDVITYAIFCDCRLRRVGVSERGNIVFSHSLEILPSQHTAVWPCDELHLISYNLLPGYVLYAKTVSATLSFRVSRVAQW